MLVILVMYQHDLPHHTGTSVLSQMQQETIIIFEQTILNYLLMQDFLMKKKLFHKRHRGKMLFLT